MNHVPDLFVGNLPFDITEEEIRQLFSRCGVVQRVNILIDQNTGNSKGVAFVRYSTEEEMRRALNEFNDFSYNNRIFRVKIAKNKQERHDQIDNKPYTRYYDDQTKIDPHQNDPRINSSSTSAPRNGTLSFDDIESQLNEHRNQLINLLSMICNSWDDEITLYKEIQNRTQPQEFNELLPLLQMLLQQSNEEKARHSISFYPNSTRPF
ncbi:RNA-binding protein [Histomonas meleagridis]|uniref:RNA-binding protein n=1 Tax=Histomonas meleagridis TaxID=135588 RepID=UPI00355A894A|nr:RNA-binding protein [Histomonas meleagridis]KAH0801313.1 RNA-binding protein [Histomonas meleagridis]